MTKRVYKLTGINEKVLLASFSIAKGVVVAIYSDDEYKADLDENGIYLSRIGTLYPADGQRFYDGLERAYANSSRMLIIEEG